MSRVIVSMTSIPARNGRRQATFESLLKQSTLPDEIRVFVDPVMLTDPELLSYAERTRAWSKGKIIPIPTRDRGPVTKLSVLLDPKIQNDDLLVTVDDDIIYEPRWLDTLIQGATKHPDYAVGFCGWNASGFLEAHRDKQAHGGTYVWPSVPGPCDVLEGWAGVCYRKGFFEFGSDGFPLVLAPLPMFRLVDDVWISWQLHRKRVPRAMIHFRMSYEPSNALPGLHHREDFVDLNRQAAIVAFGGVE